MSDTQKASSGALSLPHNLFTSQKRFDEPDANDMQCGDLSERELKEHYGLKTFLKRWIPGHASGCARPVGNYAFAAPAIVKEKMIAKRRSHYCLMKCALYQEWFLSSVTGICFSVWLITSRRAMARFSETIRWILLTGST